MRPLLMRHGRPMSSSTCMMRVPSRGSRALDGGLAQRRVLAHLHGFVGTHEVDAQLCHVCFCLRRPDRHFFSHATLCSRYILAAVLPLVLQLLYVLLGVLLVRTIEYSSSNILPWYGYLTLIVENHAASYMHVKCARYSSSSYREDGLFIRGPYTCCSTSLCHSNCVVFKALR